METGPFVKIAKKSIRGITNHTSVTKSSSFDHLIRQTSTSALNLNSSAFQSNTSSEDTNTTHYLNFNDGKECYKTKTTLSLLHSLAIYKICSFSSIVNNADTLLKYSRKVFGDKFVVSLMKPTFFNYFCAGENVEEVQRTVDRLKQYNVGAILDYAAEGDLEESTATPSPRSEILAKEKVLNDAVDTFVSCITTTGATTSNGFAAIKLTALADASILQRGTYTLDTLRYLYLTMLKDHNVTSGSTLSYDMFVTSMKKYFNKLSEPQINGLWNIMTLRLARNNILDIINNINTTTNSTSNTANVEGLADFTKYSDATQYPVDTSGSITFDDWYHGLSFYQSMILSQYVSDAYVLSNNTPSKPYVYTPGYVNFMNTGNITSTEINADIPVGITTMAQDELDAILRVYNRCNVILRTSFTSKVRTMIDAEHCYFQRVIDAFTLDFQRVYNYIPKALKNDINNVYVQNANAHQIHPVLEKMTHSNVQSGECYPIVWNTYQNYLTDSTSRMMRDVACSRKESFFWGAKLVRGAYMILENQLAKDGGFISPIHDGIERTHHNYNTNIVNILHEIRKTAVTTSTGASTTPAAVSTGVDSTNTTKTINMMEVMAASHNQQTVEVVTDTIVNMIRDDATVPHICMDPLQLSKCGVYFGQLLGMADHLTFTLGVNNFSPYKYVPYGQVMEVLPYLIRRAQENSNMLGGVGHERKMLWQEFVRRMKEKVSFL